MKTRPPLSLLIEKKGMDQPWPPPYRIELLYCLRAHVRQLAALALAPNWEDHGSVETPPTHSSTLASQSTLYQDHLPLSPCSPFHPPMVASSLSPYSLCMQEGNHAALLFDLGFDCQGSTHLSLNRFRSLGLYCSPGCRCDCQCPCRTWRGGNEMGTQLHLGANLSLGFVRRDQRVGWGSCSKVEHVRR